MIENVWEGRGWGARVLRAGLRPLSAVWGAALALRAAAHGAGWTATERAAAPVLSVGGLRVGGVGKTPLVLELARRLSERGRRPCIVTRGYGGRGLGGGALLVTAQAARDPETVALVGDEAALLALRAGVPVVVARHRAAACALATASFAPDVFLLDDGFQHRRLHRDLDIVVLTGDEADELLLPAGPLRELPRALARADVVVAMSGLPARLAAQVPAGATILRARSRAVVLVSDVADATGESTATLAGTRLVAVAAIARPARFLDDLRSCGSTVAATVLRRDHHAWTADDVAAIVAAAASARANLVVTTEKDLVKLDGLRAAMPTATAAAVGAATALRALRVAVDVEDSDALDRLLERVFEPPRSASRV